LRTSGANHQRDLERGEYRPLSFESAARADMIWLYSATCSRSRSRSASHALAVVRRCVRASKTPWSPPAARRLRGSQAQQVSAAREVAELSISTSPVTSSTPSTTTAAPRAQAGARAGYTLAIQIVGEGCDWTSRSESGVDPPSAHPPACIFRGAQLQPTITQRRSALPARHALEAGPPLERAGPTRWTLAVTAAFAW